MQTAEQAQIHREINAVREVVDARFEGIDRVLSQMGEAISRLIVTVERQVEHQVQLAVLTNTVGHLQATFIEHKMRADDRTDALESRQANLEEKVNLRNWRLNAVRAAGAALVAGAVGFVTANFDTILVLLGVG